MNKAISINLGGSVFTIEENAYEILQKYITNLRNYFGKSGDTDEIIADIEQRMAEMFTENAKSKSVYVITEADVERTIELMGQPSDFETESESMEEEEPVSGTKRLYRDVENNVLGGVCAGIAAYFNTNPIWIRILFLFLVLFSFGSVCIAYLILWGIIPQAKTRLEKMSMRGETINIANLQKSVKEEFESVKDNFTGKNKSSNNVFAGLGKFANNLFELLLAFLKRIFQVGGRVFGVLFIVFGVGALIALLGGLIGFLTYAASDYSVFYPFKLFDFQAHSFYFSFAVLVLLIPILSLFLAGLQMLLKISIFNKVLVLTFAALWIVSFGITMTELGKTVFQYKQEGEVIEVENLQAQKTYHLKLNEGTLKDYQNRVASNKQVHIDFDGNNETVTSVDLRIKRSDDGTTFLRKKFKSRGVMVADAIERIREMKYNYRQEDSIIYMDYAFDVPISTMYYGQEVDLELIIPDNTILLFDVNMKHIWQYYHYYDCQVIENGVEYNKLIMTKEGLKCFTTFTQEEEDSL
ncbi:MAG: phage shock protein PspC (stress-responsive transcriptional regulator) [Sphingobacteriales bacterium]|jgi:phage shock protein PspC (stress-responsive transcriptional regulator)